MEIPSPDIEKVLNVRSETVAIDQAIYPIDTSIQPLNHHVSSIVDDINIVTGTTAHGVRARPTIKQVIASTAYERIVARATTTAEDVVSITTVNNIITSRTIQRVIPTQPLNLIAKRGPENHIIPSRTNDQIHHRRGRHRGHCLQRTEVIGVGDHHPQLQPGLRHRHGEGLLGCADDVVEDAAATRLPLVRQRRVGWAIRVGEGAGGGQLLPYYRGGVADQHGADRCVVDLNR